MLRPTRPLVGLRHVYGTRQALSHARGIATVSADTQRSWPFGLCGAVVVAGAALGVRELYARSYSSSTKLHCEEVQPEKSRKEPKEKEQAEAEADDDSSIFSTLSAHLPSMPDIKMPDMPTVDLPDLPDFGGTLQSWRESFTELSNNVSELQFELSGGPGSVYHRTVAGREDAQKNPEVEWDAQVRLGNDLGTAERAFMRARKEAMLKPFCKLMGVEESEVDVRDIPVVAVAGSGGGYRAMVSTLGSLSAMQSSGLWDLTSYASAISGSCWALNTLFSVGHGDIERTLDHIKKRITTPFLDQESLTILTNKPTNEYVLSGAIHKQANKNGEINIVDAYGTLVSCRLYVPDKTDDPVSALDLKTSSQRRYLDDGSHPLPIYCTTHHEIPQDKKDEIAKNKEQQRTSMSKKKRAEAEEKNRELKKQGRWLWFETTPYEFGCDELGAWIPTWSLGRLFEAGKSVERVPELSLTITTGIYASAFCATLFSYYSEIRPVLAALPFYSKLNGFVQENQAQLDSIHPFPPAELPNFLRGMSVDALQAASTNDSIKLPDKITEKSTLGFIDAGAVCNVPYTPLFRRDCDLIIALDASADSQDIWFRRAQDYAAQRSLDTLWPRIKPEQLFPGSGDAEPEREPTVSEANNPATKESASDLAATKVDQAKTQETDSAAAPHEAQSINPQTPPVGSAPQSAQTAARAAAAKSEQQSTTDGKPMPESSSGEPKLGKCNIWIGSSKKEHEGASCRRDQPTEQDVIERDGIALVYYPLTGGPELENVADVWSTWRFEYTAEETDKMIKLARANFKTGEEQIKTLIRGLWQRKKALRLAAEKEGK